MRENRIEKMLVRVVRERGGKCYKWVSPGTRGVPDRIVIMPGGRTFYVETKAPGRELSPLQAKKFKELRALGHEVHKIDTILGVYEFAIKVLDGSETR